MTFDLARPTGAAEVSFPVKNDQGGRWRQVWRIGEIQTDRWMITEVRVEDSTASHPPLILTSSDSVFEGARQVQAEGESYDPYDDRHYGFAHNTPNQTALGASFVGKDAGGVYRTLASAEADLERLYLQQSHDFNFQTVDDPPVDRYGGRYQSHHIFEDGGLLTTRDWKHGVGVASHHSYTWMLPLTPKVFGGLSRFSVAGEPDLIYTGSSQYHYTNTSLMATELVAWSPWHNFQIRVTTPGARSRPWDGAPDVGPDEYLKGYGLFFSESPPGPGIPDGIFKAYCSDISSTPDNSMQPLYSARHMARYEVELRQ